MEVYSLTMPNDHIPVARRGRLRKLPGNTHVPAGPEAARADRATLEIAASATLFREHEFIAAVLSVAGALVTVLDRGGAIVLFNRTCEELTGYSFEEVRGRVLWDFLLPPELADEVKAVFGALAAGFFPNAHENEWVAKDGRRRLIAEYVYPNGLVLTNHVLMSESPPPATAVAPKRW